MKESLLSKRLLHVTHPHVTRSPRRVRWYDRRNGEIADRFHHLYGRMPTMRIYTRLAREYGLSEDTIRRIIRHIIRHCPP